MSTNSRKRRTQSEQDLSQSERSPEPDAHRRRLTSGAARSAADGGDDGVQSEYNILDHMVKGLIRLALANEYQRRAIRRSEINEKVLGLATRQFKHVFSQAQLQLRTVFGMELVELPAKERITLQQLRAAQRTSSQNKATLSWSLVSILPSKFRTDEAVWPSAIPTVVEESKYVGIYTLAVSLIVLSGGLLKDAKMDRYLRRAGLEDETPIRSHSQTEKLLKRMERDGYIYKVKENTGTSEDELYWTVGPRGKSEVGEHGAKSLVFAMYGNLPDDQVSELERKIDRSLAVSDKSTKQANEAVQARKQRKRWSQQGANRNSDYTVEHDADQDEESEDEGTDGI